MGDKQFRMLYKEDKKPADRVGPDEPGDSEIGPAITKLGLLVGSGMLVAGLVLFSLQWMSSSDTATPLNTFAIMLVEDHIGIDDAAEDEEPADVYLHYKEAPGEEFVARFQGLIDKTELPEGVVAVEAELSEREARYLVREGEEPGEPNEIMGDPRYVVLRIETGDVEKLLGGLSEEPGAVEDRFLLGPFPFKGESGTLEMVMEEGRVPIARKLPGNASAFQGFIIVPKREIKANSLLLLPSGDLSVEDFYRSVSAVSFADNWEDLDLVPRPNYSGYRHSLLIFLLAVLGELVFLAGGYILIYRFYVPFPASLSRKAREYATCLLTPAPSL